MKQVHYLSFFLFLFTAISFASCSDDDNDNGSQTGITGQTWKEGIPVELTAGSVQSVTFNAAAKWKAYTNSTWCNLQTTEGEKGASTIKLSVTTTDTKDRTSTITIKVEGYTTTSFQVTQKGSSETISEDMQLNGKVDDYLRKMYLWNEEYKTLTPDYQKNYEDFFYGALKSMTTNTLDYKTYTEDNGETYRRLFSYIQKLPNITSTRSPEQYKQLAYSFGITGITYLAFGSQKDHTNYFCIQGVHPDSPASEAGLKRGAMISMVNGKKMSDSEINDYYYNMQLPDAAISYTLTEDIIKGGSITGQKEYTLTARAMYSNPVIFSGVKEDIEGHRIGYLVYSAFEAGFDQELFTVFKEFKNKNITDLILDLRYNGGGYTMSANLIATCIAGAASQGKVFNSLRYNDERMKNDYNNKRPEELFAYSNYPNLGTSLSAGSLDLPRVYCLVGNGTASASELVINSLRGIGVEVILIGKKTTGKNVGMEYEDMKVGKNTYRVVPITFQSYNAEGFGDYQDGFKPNEEIDETNPYNLQDNFYILKEYMTNEEPLYAKAIELITGKNPMPTTRSVANTLDGSARKLPAIFRPGREGMLKPAKTAE